MQKPMQYSNPIDFDIDLNEVSKGNKLIPQVQSQLGQGLTGKESWYVKKDPTYKDINTSIT